MTLMAVMAMVAGCGSDKKAADGEKVLHLIIHEGRFHQVKRMIYALGGEVTYLRREGIGSILLDKDLDKGTYRYERRGICLAPRV